jgi:hypothetical protein
VICFAVYVGWRTNSSSKCGFKTGRAWAVKALPRHISAFLELLTRRSPPQ